MTTPAQDAAMDAATDILRGLGGAWEGTRVVWRSDDALGAWAVRPGAPDLWLGIKPARIRHRARIQRRNVRRAHRPPFDPAILTMILTAIPGMIATGVKAVAELRKKP